MDRGKAALLAGVTGLLIVAGGLQLAYASSHHAWLWGNGTSTAHRAAGNGPLITAATQLTYTTADPAVVESDGAFKEQVVHFSLVDQSQQVVGTLDAHLVATYTTPEDPDNPAVLITGAASLPNGQVSFEGSVYLNTDGFDLAVTGGTGSYQKVRGYVHVTPDQQSEEPAATFTFTLYPGHVA